MYEGTQTSQRRSYPRRKVAWHVELRELLLTGMRIEDIAQKMGITYGTAKIYVSKFYQRFGVGSRAQLMADEIERLRGELGLQVGITGAD